MSISKNNFVRVSKKISISLIFFLFFLICFYLFSLNTTKKLEFSGEQIAQKTSERLPFNFSINSFSSDSNITINSINFLLEKGKIYGDVNGTIKMNNIFLIKDRNAKVHANFVAIPEIKSNEAAETIDIYLEPENVFFDDINFSLKNNEGKIVESVLVNQKINKHKEKYADAIISKFNSEPIFSIKVSDKLQSGEKKLIYGSKAYIENDKIVIKQQMLNYYLDKIIPYLIISFVALVLLLIILFIPEVIFDLIF